MTFRQRERPLLLLLIFFLITMANKGVGSTIHFIIYFWNIFTGTCNVLYCDVVIRSYLLGHQFRQDYDYWNQGIARRNYCSCFLILWATRSFLWSWQLRETYRSSEETTNTSISFWELRKVGLQQPTSAFFYFSNFWAFLLFYAIIIDRRSSLMARVSCRLDLDILAHFLVCWSVSLTLPHLVRPSLTSGLAMLALPPSETYTHILSLSHTHIISLPERGGCIRASRFERGFLFCSPSAALEIQK